MPGLGDQSPAQVLRADFRKVVPEAQRSAEDKVFDNWHYVIIDVPGPTDFIKDMSAGVPADRTFHHCDGQEKTTRTALEAETPLRRKQDEQG